MMHPMDVKMIACSLATGLVMMARTVSMILQMVLMHAQLAMGQQKAKEKESVWTRKDRPT
jgi:hypothetical protein